MYVCVCLCVCVCVCVCVFVYNGLRGALLSNVRSGSGTGQILHR